MRAALLLPSLFAAALAGQAAVAQTPPVPNPPKWVFEDPPKQLALNHAYAHVATIVTQLGVAHDLCWYNPVTKVVGGRTVEETALQIAHRRYRLEGGPVETSAVVPYARWLPERTSANVVIPRKYCVKADGLTVAGHWAYEAMICRIPYVSDSASCSAWMPSIEPNLHNRGGGVLPDGTRRGWWIYAYDGSLARSRT
jgi:hypothetical protein